MPNVYRTGSAIAAAALLAIAAAGADGAPNRSYTCLSR
jgi:hypothetical protein